MKPAEALKRVGGEIVKTEKTASSTILFLRIKPDRAEAWAEAVSELLLSKQDTWAAEVSKVFFVPKGEHIVKYLWRVIFRGELKDAVFAFSQSCIRAASTGVQFDSFPLVGRKEYPFDPANGKMAGGHTPAEAARALAMNGVGQ